MPSGGGDECRDGRSVSYNKGKNVRTNLPRYPQRDSKDAALSNNPPVHLHQGQLAHASSSQFRNPGTSGT